MGNVLIDNLVAGMIVASDVFDRSGRLLLGAGVELNDTHRRMFRSWGIPEVDIVGCDTQETTQPVDNGIDAQRLQEMEAELKPRFRNTNLAYPAMGELFRLCLLRKFFHESP
jgi:hypothetical protein